MRLSEGQFPVRYHAGVQRCEALAQECEALFRRVGEKNGEPLAEDISEEIRATRDRLNAAVLVLEARAGDEHPVSIAVEQRCADIYRRFKVLLDELPPPPLTRSFGKMDRRVCRIGEDHRGFRGR